MLLSQADYCWHVLGPHAETQDEASCTRKPERRGALAVKETRAVFVVRQIKADTAERMRIEQRLKAVRRRNV